MDNFRSEISTENKRYTLTTHATPDGPVYIIVDTLTGAAIESGYGCEKWAQRRADWMNYKEMERNGTNRSTGLCADGKERNRKD